MRHAFLAAMLTLATPAHAEVKRATASGFELEGRVTVPVPPAQAFAALGELPQWWDPAHTYSGAAANLSFGLKVGDCFCERVPSDGGSIEHARVVMSRPGSTLRLHGALGPLQSQGVAGSLTYALRPVAGGTEVTQTYVVGGYFTISAETLAPLVDQVTTTQLNRYRDRLAK